MGLNRPINSCGSGPFRPLESNLIAAASTSSVYNFATRFYYSLFPKNIRDRLSQDPNATASIFDNNAQESNYSKSTPATMPPDTELPDLDEPVEEQHIDIVPDYFFVTTALFNLAAAIFQAACVQLLTYFATQYNNNVSGSSEGFANDNGGRPHESEIIPSLFDKASVLCVGSAFCILTMALLLLYKMGRITGKTASVAQLAVIAVCHFASAFVTGGLTSPYGAAGPPACFLQFAGIAGGRRLLAIFSMGYVLHLFLLTYFDQNGYIDTTPIDRQTLAWLQVSQSATVVPFLILGAFLSEVRRKESERRLRNLAGKATEASKAKSTFLAVMSHEMRTPLNHVMIMADLLEHELEPAAQKGTDNSGVSQEWAARVRQCTELLSTMRGSAQMLLDVIDDVLDLSKIEAGKLELDPRPNDMLELAKRIIKIFGPNAKRKGLELELSAPANLPLLLFDRLKVRQIVTNLVGNAMKFTANGSIRVQLSLEKGKVVIAVTDTGVGITEEEMARLFKPFSQAESTRTTRKYGGSGLGLVIARQLARLMGGDLTVASKKGAGSTFTFQMPANLAPKGVTPEPFSPAEMEMVRVRPGFPPVSDVSRLHTLFLGEAVKSPVIRRRLTGDGTKTRSLETAVLSDLGAPRVSSMPDFSVFNRGQSPDLSLIWKSTCAKPEKTGEIYRLLNDGVISEMLRSAISARNDVTSGGDDSRDSEAKSSEKGVDFPQLIESISVAVDPRGRSLESFVKKGHGPPGLASTGAFAAESAFELESKWADLSLLVPAPIGEAAYAEKAGLSTNESHPLGGILRAARGRLARYGSGSQKNNVFGSEEAGKKGAKSDTETQAPAQSLPSETNLIGHHILVVDDNELNAKLTARLLQCLGAKVTTAFNGQTAIAKVCESPSEFDAMLLDICMPEMDGFEVARRIRAVEQEQDRRPLPIVALTAMTLTADRERALATGMHDFVTKPFSKQILLHKIKSAITAAGNTP